MNQKFGKLIFVDNGSDLSTTLSSNFEIGKGSIDYVFHKFRWIFLGRGYKITLQKFSKNFSTVPEPENFRKSYKV